MSNGMHPETPSDSASGESYVTMERMAETFVVEFLRMGYSADAVLSLFQNPFYVAPHSVYLLRGEEWVWALIQRTVTGEEIAHG